jgi:hypothetical protein
VDSRCKNASVEPGLYSGIEDDGVVYCDIRGTFVFFLDRARESKAVSFGVDVGLVGELLRSG